ncbi:hypothetical protein FBU59_003196 [Linderina macrospora]|uniref:Uncharacterized protein n=1 Tax=Linderina macrospora TaxID=4868 RepID=A0ACC1J976_9FUNG|nr:hypothetical protein FBU59_003196 [Linderina macrospora]
MLAGDLSGLLEIIRSVAPRKRSLGVELDLHGHCPFLTASGPQVLTSISITMRTWTGAHVEFIRYHAETLQALTVHNITTWSLQDLLTDGNRPNVVFPNLMLLDIELRDSRRGQALDIQRTPFPALRCFRNKGIYPFSNDAVLYTDQLSSLEYLRLTMDSAVFTTLNAANAFKSRKYPVLRTVEILVDNNPFVIAEAVQGWSMFAAVFEISETAKC